MTSNDGSELSLVGSQSIPTVRGELGATTLVATLRMVRLRSGTAVLQS